MSGSREQMLRLLQEAKATVRARIPDASSAHRRHGPRRARQGAAATEDASAKEGETTTASPITEANGTAETVTNKLDAKEKTMEFLNLYYQIFRGFALDPTKFKLPLEGLDGSARRVLHVLAERCNLDHHSAGTGDTRAIMIEKGPLFYQHQDAYQTVDLERIATELNSKTSKFELKRAARIKDEDITSGIIGSYDEDAYKKVQRFQRSTDEYRHAVDMGYTQEDLQRLEGSGSALGTDGDKDGDDDETKARLRLATSGRRLEELLSRPGDGPEDDLAAQDVVGRSRPKGTPPPPSTAGTTSNTAATIATSATALPPGSKSSTTHAEPAPSHADTRTAAAAAPPKPTAYEETCRGCWTRQPLTIALRDWRCSKYCTQCGKDTIWMLRPIAEPTPDASGDSKSAKDKINGDADSSKADGVNDSTGDAAAKKRKREAGGSLSSDDDDDDVSGEDAMAEEEEEDDVLEVDDVVEMANGNDLEAADVNWLRRFCTSHAATLQRHITFCIDLHDLLQLPIFQRPVRHARHHTRRQEAKRARTENSSPADEVSDRMPQYVLVRANKTTHTSLSSLIEKIVAVAFTRGTGDGARPVSAEEALAHVAIALPNTSVYGTEALAVIQLRPSSPLDATADALVVNVAALAELEREFGARHVHLSTELETVIKDAE